MKIIITQLLLLISSIGFISAQDQSIDNLLFELPDVIFERVKSLDSNSIAFELKIKQPIDHNNPEEGYFYQRAFLNHKGINNPTVFVTEGYTCTANWPTELAGLLDANQLAVEHRYFGESIPVDTTYSFLNLEQATADLHHINQLFKGIYKNKWISTGISKGGATTIFYRYFYPNDVDVSVPYVAPINNEFEEQRIYDFFDTISTNECRKKIEKLQIRLLKNRKKIMPLIRFYAKGARLNFSYLPIEEAFEYAVLEYPFSFFQWGNDCEDIPQKDASIEVITSYLLDVSGVAFFSDRSMDAFAPHYYQSANEMGYYGYEIDKFKKLIKYLPTDTNPFAAFTLNNMVVEFDGSLLDEINAWLPENGNRIIYIYGANDTWSASAVQPSDKVDALWFFMGGKDHGNARIKNMNINDRKLLISTLERWLQTEIIE